MTDEKAIEWLRKIKEHCRKCDYDCGGCPFKLKEHNVVVDEYSKCHIRILLLHLSKFTPECWDMEEIERIIRL